MSRPSSQPERKFVIKWEFVYEKDYSGLPAFERVVVNVFEMLNDSRRNRRK